MLSIRFVPCVVFRRIRTSAKSDLIRHVRLSVSVEQLGSHWTGFLEIRYLSFSGKSVGGGGDSDFIKIYQE
jgi:hypothetical protein